MTQKDLKYRAEYALFMTLALIARTLPRETALRFGRHLGSLSRLVQKKRVQTASHNMRHAFPEMRQSEIDRNVREVFCHLGVSGIEMLRLDMFKGKEDLERYFTFSGLEHLQQAYAEGQGALLLSGHIGFWEVGTFFLPLLGFPADFVAKRMKNPYVDRYFEKLREAGGGKCLESKKGARRILRSLSKNRGVAVLLDQHISRNEAVRVDFFNRPAYTTPIITQIAMKQGTPIVPVFVYRTKDYRYEVVVEPMIQFENEPGDEAVLSNTAVLNDIIEQAVRKDITQWFWVHRRWR